MMYGNLEFGGTLMDIGNWLRTLGLGGYEAAFRENEINERVLPSLTQEDLKELGVAALGHRRILLDAIAALRTDASVTGLPQLWGPRRLPRAFLPKTAPSAAKSR